MKSWLLRVLVLCLGFTAVGGEPENLLTTRGSISAAEAGMILPHEHLFTDLRGPKAEGHGEADPADVERVMLPLLEEAKRLGIGTLVECTSIGVGRNVEIISALGRKSGVNIVVPTGVYGRAHFAPEEYTAMSEDELAEWMIQEIRVGIGETGVRAGFIKTAASDGELKPLEAKFLRASGRAAKATGVVIASHTTQGSVAARQADLLEDLGLALDRFIWVHAQAEKDLIHHEQLARRGVFIELDSVGASSSGDEEILRAMKHLKKAGLLNQILLSHDAGWYNPGEPNGGSQRPFTALVQTFIPALRENGFSEEEIRTLTRDNPARAFGMRESEAASSATD